MRRRHAVIAGAIGLAAIAVVVGMASAAGLSANAPREGGPLGGTDPYGYAVTVDVGGVVTDALTVLSLAPALGDAQVELISIEQVFPDESLGSAGEWVAGPDRSREALVVQQFYLEAPPRDPRLGAIGEVEGATVVSRDADEFGTQLLLGIEVAEPGHFLRDGFWVTYRYEGETYRDLIPAKVTVCTPDAVEPDGTCAFLGDE